MNRPVGSRKIPVIGILGGIGSGKSSVVRGVTGLKLFIIDADKIGHELLARSSVRDRIANEFGANVISVDGQVDRGQLGRIVFAETEDGAHARRQLEEILHPAIRSEITTKLKTIPDDTDAIVLDAALLLEAGWDSQCDRLIFVDTPQHLRQERVKSNRGWSAEELARREAAQWDLRRKRDAADGVVDNSGTPDQ
ncbi:MAG: dephospho-CoA kinase, partial [Planctomycetaceae bacterium]|nr:dephospho-CoA kinase [Planctomycetaceae bacterium]